MSRSLRSLPLAAAVVAVFTSCGNKSPDPGGPPPPVQTTRTNGSTPRDPGAVVSEASRINSALTEMGAPKTTWPPALVELFAIRLDRLEWLNKQSGDATTTRAVDEWRAQYDAFLLGDPKSAAAKDHELNCGMFQTAGDGTPIASNAAFRCLDKTAKNATVLSAGQFKQDNGSLPGKCAAQSDRLCQALVMVQQFNRQCGILAQMAVDAKDRNFVLGEALGCYLQITPVIEESLALATTKDAEISPYFQIELDTIGRYRRVLEAFQKLAP